jgi:hypothetical protein
MGGIHYRVLLVLTLLGVSACGGGPIGGPVTRTATPVPTVTPPTPAASPTSTVTPDGTPPPTATPGGGGSILPGICHIGRVVFRSQSGERCCIAADPALLPRKPQPGQPTLVLTDLPLGPATVTVDGYVEDFAPFPPDVTATCKTLNTSGIRPCDTLDASAAYGSEPKAVTIFGGVRVNLGDIDLAALPFLLAFTPPQNATVVNPVEMGFTVVDAETGIAAPSVALDITLNAPQGEPPVFRPITKRVPLALTPCNDHSGQPCSGANLGVAGFLARAVAEYLSYLPDGAVEARITAQNRAVPPRDLDFRYSFVVGVPPTPTAAFASVSAGGAGGAVFAPTPTPTATPEVP